MKKMKQKFLMILLLIILFLFCPLKMFSLYEDERQEIYNWKEFFSDLLDDPKPENSNCDPFFDVSVNPTVCQGSEVIDTVSLTEYIKGVYLAEMGGMYSDEATPDFMASWLIMMRSFVLGNNGFSKSNPKNTISVMACTGNQQWCSWEKGCTALGEWVTNYPCKEGESCPYTKENRLSQSMIDMMDEAEEISKGKVASKDNGESVATLHYFCCGARTPFAGGLDTDEQNVIDAVRKNPTATYEEILKEAYPALKSGDAQIVTWDGSSCPVDNEETGDWSKWRQTDSRWSGNKLGENDTIGRSGCLVTSLAIQIARSKTKIISELSGKFNPGTFVDYMNKHGGLDANGNWYWGSQTKVAPNFKEEKRYSVSGRSYSSIANEVDGYLKKGYYVIITVKYNGHYVVVDKVKDGEIYMIDPASDVSRLASYYDPAGIGTILVYKKYD